MPIFSQPPQTVTCAIKPMKIMKDMKISFSIYILHALHGKIKYVMLKGLGKKQANQTGENDRPPGAPGH